VDDTEAAAIIEFARTAEQAGDLKTAAESLRSLLAVDPARAATWAWLGGIESSREQYAAAIDAFSHALALNPELAAAHSQLGQVYIETGRYETAEVELRRSIEIAPTSPRFVLLGHVQEQLGRKVQAAKAYETAVELEAENEEALFNLALLTRASEPDRALTLLERAVQIDPLYAEAHRELGFTLLGVGNLTDAEHELRTALALDVRDPWAHLYLGNLLWQKNAIAEAEEQLLQACTSDLSWAFAHRSLGSFYEARGNRLKAEAEYRTAVSLDADDADAAFRLGLLLTASGSDEANVWLSRAVELDPTDVRANQAITELRRRRS
jgi:tetratricopeptide (TPR) repeat protein